MMMTLMNIVCAAGCNSRRDSVYPVTSESPAVQAIQPATVAASQPARGKTSFKGWELHVWRERDQSMYALVPGTNRLKSAEEISSTAVKGLAEIKRQLAELEKGQWVSINGRRLLQKPPQDEADALARYGEDIGLQMR